MFVIVIGSTFVDKEGNRISEKRKARKFKTLLDARSAAISSGLRIDQFSIQRAETQTKEL